MIYSGLVLGWFDEFRDYWVGELGLRPIHPPDFHFLSGIFRQRFHTLVEVSDEIALEDGWRDERSIYLQFNGVFKLAIRPLIFRRYVGYIP